MSSREHEQPDLDPAWWRAVAKRLRAENVVLVAESAGQRERIAYLEGQVGALARLAFGRSTEKGL